jgi:hypothetical protein
MTFNLDVWKLLAGLGIFLFGMFLIEEEENKVRILNVKKLKICSLARNVRQLKPFLNKWPVL